MTTKKIGDKKIASVTSSTQAKSVEGTEAVSGVRGVKATDAIGGVGRTTGVSGTKTTRTMSLAEREELFRMIDQEASKLFSDSSIPAAKRKVVESAVKMAIDASLMPADDDDSDDSKKK